METKHEKLRVLYEEYYGGPPAVDESDIGMIVDILEQLLEKVEELDGHSHNIS